MSKKSKGVRQKGLTRHQSNFNQKFLDNLTIFITKEFRQPDESIIRRKNNNQRRNNKTIILSDPKRVYQPMHISDDHFSMSEDSISIVPSPQNQPLKRKHRRKRRVKRRVEFVGLKNDFGSTCYQNSSLQILFNVLQTYDVTLPDIQKKNIPPVTHQRCWNQLLFRPTLSAVFWFGWIRKHGRLTVTEMNILMRKLKEYLVTMNNTVIIDLLKSYLGAIDSPRVDLDFKFYSQFKNLFDVVKKNQIDCTDKTDFIETLDKHFRNNYRQEDCSEFFTYTYERLEYCLINFIQNYSTLLSDIFQGQATNNYICGNCKCEWTSKTVDDWSYITVSLENCIQNKSTPSGNKKMDIDLDLGFERVWETYCGWEQNIEFKCPFCKTKTMCEKRIEILNLPKILATHIKRWDFEMTTKLMDRIETPTNFSIKGERYQLFGYIIHRGTTYHSGHYFCYLWKNNKQKWYCFDDVKVIPYEKLPFLHETDTKSLILYKKK